MRLAVILGFFFRGLMDCPFVVPCRSAPCPESCQLYARAMKASCGRCTPLRDPREESGSNGQYLRAARGRRPMLPPTRRLPPSRPPEKRAPARPRIRATAAGLLPIQLPYPDRRTGQCAVNTPSLPFPPHRLFLSPPLLVRTHALTDALSD